MTTAKKTNRQLAREHIERIERCWKSAFDFAFAVYRGNRKAAGEYADQITRDAWQQLPEHRDQENAR